MFRQVRRSIWAPAVMTVVCLTVFLAPVAAQRITFSFDDDPLAAPPASFFFAAARQTTPGTWEIKGAGNKRHLSHSADPSVTLRGISIAGANVEAPTNIKLSTRLHLTDGDAAGGVLWRYRDSSNFYFMAVVYADHSAGVFRVTEGNRVMLDQVKDINLDPDAWHVMTIIHDGDEIRGAIDGIGVLRARDRGLTDGRRAGVWSGGNTTAWFDDVTIEHVPE